MGIGVSIVGSGHTKFGRLQENLEQLIVAASQEALQEAGITGNEVDAVFLGHFNAGMAADAFASSLILQADEGLRFKPATRFENACASGAAAVYAAIDAIKAGRIEVALVVGVEKMTHNDTAGVTRALAGAGYQNHPDEAGVSFPAVFARAAQIYGERHGDPMTAMAKIAAKNHSNAMLNPYAQLRKDLGFEFCNTVSEKNPLIEPSLRMSDCSLISDGAAAVVLVAEHRAAEFALRAHFAAAVHVSDLLPLHSRDWASFVGPEKAIQAAYAQAGISVQDLNFAEVHDCFTIAELLLYEAMGLADKGKGFEALDSGAVYRDGALPVNVSGGLKAKGHPVGATGVSMHVLAYRQLTGQAGEMQLAAPKLGLVFNMGGAAVANYASVLSA